MRMTYLRWFCFILISIPLLLNGQPIEKVISKSTNEAYYVLKSDHVTRHGPYQKMGYQNGVDVNGYYKNGLQDSLWIYYTGTGRQAYTQGNYQKGKRTGIWETFDNKGILKQQYDFSGDKLLYYKEDDNDKIRLYKVFTGSDAIETKLGSPPIYIGKDNMMILVRNIKYPPLAREHSVSGIVNIAFKVNKDGQTSGHYVKDGIGSGCDEEALRVVKMIPDNWIPGTLNNQAVDVETFMPVSFRLQ